MTKPQYETPIAVLNQVEQWWSRLTREKQGVVEYNSLALPIRPPLKTETEAESAVLLQMALVREVLPMVMDSLSRPIRNPDEFELEPLYRELQRYLTLIINGKSRYFRKVSSEEEMEYFRLQGKETPRYNCLTISAAYNGRHAIVGGVFENRRLANAKSTKQKYDVVSSAGFYWTPRGLKKDYATE